MRKDKYLERLSQVDLFQALSKKELAMLGRLAETVDVDAGHELTKEGSTGREFFVISEGTASVTRSGKKVATLGPGDFFGELSLLENAPRNATIKAESPMQVIVLGQREFLGALDESPHLSFKLLKGMARRLREADARAVR